MAIPEMSSADARNLYLEALQRELGHDLSFARSAVARHDVWRMTEACLRCPGAMHTLVEVLHLFHRGTIPLDALEAVVDSHVPRPLLRTAERRTLRELTEDLPRVGLGAAYRATVGPAAGWSEPEPDDLPAMLARLEEMVGMPGRPAMLLVFLARLAQRQDRSRAERLYAWIAEHLQRRNQPAAAVAAVLDAAAPETAVLFRTYFVVQLEPDPLDPDGYRLAAWLQRDNGPGETLFRDDRIWTLDEVPAQVDVLLARALGEVAPQADELTVEFILPRHLLGAPVDQWRTGAESGQIEHRLGIAHSVVLRCLERLRARNLHYQWRKKWNWLRGHGGAYDAEAFYWVPASGVTELETIMADIMGEDRRVCLILSYPPPELSGLNRDELGAGICAGTPVAIWCRDSRDPDRFSAELRQRLKGKALVELPHIALKMRREAVGADEHLGNHLSVLWDDFDRLPEPYVPLAVPS